jgi:hypothetical protein
MVLDKGKRLLGRKLVQFGVDKMLKSLTVQATFNDGLKTVIIEFSLIANNNNTRTNLINFYV